MGGGSLGFGGSIFSFCTALLKAYCEDKRHNDDQMVLFCFLLLFAVDGDVYLSLDLPKLRFFSTVHLTVDDQDVGEASDVASLHLQRSRTRGFKAAGQMHDPVAACEPWGVGLTVG